MEWITAVRKSVKFIEEHLKDKISAQNVSCCTGFVKGFSYDTANDEIPKYWDEICKKYAANVYAGNAPANEYEKALVENCIGEYGVCIDDEKLILIIIRLCGFR